MRAALACSLALWAADARADRCAELHGLVDHVEAGSLNLTQAEAYSGSPDCTISHDERGGKTYLCHWQFPYRDTAATAAFEALDQDIRECFKDATALPADTAVNHPDSYLLRRYQRGKIAISASLKDKAALSQSLVFLRIDQD